MRMFILCYPNKKFIPELTRHIAIRIPPNCRSVTRPNFLIREIPKITHNNPKVCMIIG